MKRVTVLIPDHVVTVISSSSGRAVMERLDVTPKLMVRALTTNDYHPITEWGISDEAGPDRSRDGEDEEG
jgi:hypothetical protein